MNKAFKTYALIWVIVLIVFNVICFATPSEIAGMPKYNGGFWAGYILITLAFVGQLFCVKIAFKAENLTRLFYNIPIISISYTGLVIMLVVGGITMGLPQIPAWVGIIACMIILSFTAIAVIKASAAANVVESIDEKIKLKAATMKSMIADAEILMNNADDSVKKDCKAVYEALRYSDPMSNDDLIEIENQIGSLLDLFKQSIEEDQVDKIAAAKNRLLSLIDDRNMKCKYLK